MHMDTFLHVGFKSDGTQKAVLSVNPDRDVSAAWAYIHKDITEDHTLHMWFYGVKRPTEIDLIFEQTESAILDGTFADWFV